MDGHEMNFLQSNQTDEFNTGNEWAQTSVDENSIRDNPISKFEEVAHEIITVNQQELQGPPETIEEPSEIPSGDESISFSQNHSQIIRTEENKRDQRENMNFNKKKERIYSNQTFSYEETPDDKLFDLLNITKYSQQSQCQNIDPLSKDLLLKVETMFDSEIIIH